jgi:hypothetical protein
MLRFNETLAEIKKKKPEYMNHLRPKDENTLCIMPDLRSSDFCITHRCPPQECNRFINP